eukprot:m.370019 g.370019  ORF g.370019 m.370019 type:complete len:163 (+) comp19990_c0_seq29:106-594(+)
MDVQSPRGVTMLMCAAALGLTEMVRTLIKAESDVNVPALIASAEGCQGNADIKWRGFTALHFATLFGHATITHVLLQAGANAEGIAGALCSRPDAALSVGTDEQYSPLQLAAWSGDVESSVALLTAGADPYRYIRVLSNSSKSNQCHVVVVSFVHWLTETKS